MSKGTKITSFFDARRREAFLNSWEHLKSSAGESRIKLDLSLPLLNRSRQAMPDAVSKAYAVMCEDRANISRTNLDIFCEGMTLELFVTDESKSPIVMSTGVLVQKVHMVAAGEGEKRSLDLNATIYVPANVNLRDWAWEHLHGTFFLEATYSQSEMEFTNEESEDEADEEPEPSEPAAKSDILDFTESDPEPTFL